MFVASPKRRIGHDSGCPCCASKKACISNSLQSLYSAIAAEYDTAKNGNGPEEVLLRSHKKVFWKDANGQTWEEAPYQRTHPDTRKARRAFVTARFEQQA